MTDDRQRYQHNLRCRACAHRFHVIRLTPDTDKVRPNCPKCGGKTKQSFQADVGMDVSAGKAPGLVGSVPVRAFDTSMEIAMQDHGMTDIRDNARPGENTAPKLPQHLQAKVDGFWGQQQQKPKTRTARVDMSPIFGERATGVPAAQFKADSGSLIEPILKHKPPGSSPIPPQRVVGDTWNGRTHVVR